MQKWLAILFLTLFSGCAQFSEPDKTQFEIQPQTVLDKNTKLMWASSDNTESLIWQDAVEYCETYNGGGYQDWRMPKKAELQTLIDANIHKEGDVIYITSNLVWASETDGTKAAFCHLKNEGCSWMERVISISLRALPVRDTKTDTQNSLVSDTPATAETIRPQTVTQRLQVIDILHKQQLITQDEYNQKKAAILDEL